MRSARLGWECPQDASAVLDDDEEICERAPYRTSVPSRPCQPVPTIPCLLRPMSANPWFRFRFGCGQTILDWTGGLNWTVRSTVPYSKVVSRPQTRVQQTQDQTTGGVAGTTGDFLPYMWGDSTLRQYCFCTVPSCHRTASRCHDGGEICMWDDLIFHVYVHSTVYWRW